ncbi:hypothetical protein MO973_08545 [Paenibacillus sp. TRM 82003]|nr:hypothetical protein [Paenibacillus sp. TRM 82003]
MQRMRAKAIGSIGLTIALASGIAMGISWIGGLDPTIVTPEGEPLEVFSERVTRSITRETIVDELVALGLTSGIRRVSVGPTVLEIDLSVRGDAVDPAAVEADLGRLAKLALAESSNIGRIYVRVIETDSGKAGQPFLLALTGGKAEFSERELQRLRDGERIPPEWTREKMRLTVTDRWRELTEEAVRF